MSLYKLFTYVFFTYQGHLYIIDVSQAVDLDHPYTHCLLLEDCKHVSVSSPSNYL